MTRTNIYAIFAVLAAVCMTSILAQTAFAGTIAGKSISVVLSDKTGQVENISDSKGTKYLSSNTDRYDLADKPFSEDEDTVVSSRVDRDTASFECVNKAAGLKLSKVYRLKNNLLEKEVKYAACSPEKLLLKVSSQSLLSSSLYKGGYYYTATDDGYKVNTVPYIPESTVTGSCPWSISTGNFTYYIPKRDQVFAHYRYKLNGKHVFGEALSDIESKYIPGGAITALGAAFVSNKETFSLVSHYILLNGDPRDYHKHIYSQPPFTDYKNGKVPEWFKHARMYFGDDVIGIGKGLIEDREAVARDVMSTVKLLKDDECLMVFFNHWSTTGDYPYQGTFRYLTYNTPNSWVDPPAPVETLKKNIAWLKSLSPKIKVGGYVFIHPSVISYPYLIHKEWFLYGQDGGITPGADGVMDCAQPDMSTGYKDYLLDQMKHMVTDTGFDWIHLDWLPVDAVNWKTRNVVQSGTAAEFTRDLGKYLADHDKALVENAAWASGLWAQGAYYECQQPDRWEKKDWRILSCGGYVADLCRTVRPGTWVNLVYGTQGMYGIRNAATGMRGWTRGYLTWWRGIAQSLAYENVVDELLETRLSDANVTPSWWKLQTDKLETEALQKGKGTLISILLHGDKPSEETISLKASDLKVKKDNYVFGFDFKLAPATGVDIYKATPYKEDRIELIGFNAKKGSDDVYSHRMNLDPLRNYYYALTQVPAWVYSYNGHRTSFLMPEIRGVKISGLLPVGTRQYSLVVDNNNASAEILAYIPGDWTGVDARINGRTIAPIITDVRGSKCLLIGVGMGRSAIQVSLSDSLAFDKLRKVDYRNPQENVWEETAQRIAYTNLQHRAFQEDGKVCLALKCTANGGGAASYRIYPGVSADGFSLKAKGKNSGGLMTVSMSAGDTWNYMIKDDFVGWKEFSIRKNDMSTASSAKKLGAVTNLLISVSPMNDDEMTIADLHLLPSTEKEVASVPVKRSINAFRTKTTPAIDGLVKDDCWAYAPAATDFYGYGGKALSDSKTNVRVSYDDVNLYVYFDNWESIDSLGSRLARDSAIWNSDHVELFIDPNLGKGDWFQLLVDPAGTIEDIHYTGFGPDSAWNGEFEVKTALNWKASWRCELRVPFSILGKTPKAGDVWGINFGRKDLSAEFSNWASGGEWLDPAAFGEVKFCGDF